MGEETRLENVEADWHLIKLDQRAFWNDELQKQTTKIFTIFAFDRSLHVHCCELTPSYEMWFIAYEAVPVPELSDEAREELYCTVESEFDSDLVRYFHAADIERLEGQMKKVDVEIDLDADDVRMKTAEQIMELWNTGSLSF